MAKTTREELAEIRKKLFRLQAEHLEILCGDTDAETETEIQYAFGMLLWQIDEESRRDPGNLIRLKGL